MSRKRGRELVSMCNNRNMDYIDEEKGRAAKFKQVIMAKYENSASWAEDDFMETTGDPNVSVSSVLSEEVPAMTVATIIGVSVVILVGIALVFLLGVLIDWRQQKLLDKKMGDAKRMKKQRRVNTHPEDDSASIANNMEESGLSIPPAEALQNIP